MPKRKMYFTRYWHPSIFGNKLSHAMNHLVDLHICYKLGVDPIKKYHEFKCLREKLLHELAIELLKSCIDFKVLEEILGMHYNVTIPMGKPGTYKARSGFGCECRTTCYGQLVHMNHTYSFIDTFFMHKSVPKLKKFLIRLRDGAYRFWLPKKINKKLKEAREKAKFFTESMIPEIDVDTDDKEEDLPVRNRAYEINLEKSWSLRDKYTIIENSASDSDSDSDSDDFSVD